MPGAFSFQRILGRLCRCDALTTAPGVGPQSGGIAQPAGCAVHELHPLWDMACTWRVCRHHAASLTLPGQPPKCLHLMQAVAVGSVEGESIGMLIRILDIGSFPINLQ